MSYYQMLKSLLTLPLTKGLDIDDPRATSLRKQIIKEKPFLKKIYDEWYREITEEFIDVQAPILEIGSGAGHLSESFQVITSDLVAYSNIQIVLTIIQSNQKYNTLLNNQELHQELMPESLFLINTIPFFFALNT